MQDDIRVKGRKQTGKLNQQTNESRLGVPLLHTGSLLFRNGYIRHAMPCHARKTDWGIAVGSLPQQGPHYVRWERPHNGRKQQDDRL